MASSVTREVFVDEMRPTTTTVFEVGQIHYLPTYRKRASNDEGKEAVGGDTDEQAMNDEESG